MAIINSKIQKLKTFEQLNAGDLVWVYKLDHKGCLQYGEVEISKIADYSEKYIRLIFNENNSNVSWVHPLVRPKCSIHQFNHDDDRIVSTYKLDDAEIMEQFNFVIV